MRTGNRSAIGFLAAALCACAVGPTYGGVAEYTDKHEWIAAVGAFTTIDFTGFPDGTFITDQYAHLGVLFTDGNDTFFFNPGSFPNDEWGVDGNGDINVSFDTPQAWIAVDFPGDVQFELFRDGELIYTSSEFGGGGVGFFAGLASSELFDAVVISDWVDGQVAIDDLHFGVPAPGALALLALFGLRHRRRRCAANRRGLP